MSCPRTHHGDACGDRTQDLSIQSPTLYHYATALPRAILFSGSLGKLENNEGNWVLLEDNTLGFRKLGARKRLLGS